MTTTIRRACGAEGCGNRLAPTASARTKYCSDRCRQRESKRRYRAREVVQVAGNTTDPMPSGDVYEALATNSTLVDKLLTGAITQQSLAEVLGVSPSAVSKALAAVTMEKADHQAAQLWEMDDEVADMLALDALDAPCNCQCDRLDEWLDHMVEAFTRFRTRFFHTQTGLYYTEDFHKEWIRAILRTMVLGGRQLILSPPRHGKSELLVHFCVWLICRKPNIRIMWIGGNSDIAGDMVSAVKTELEENTDLRLAVLAPGMDFQPPWRKSKAWGSSKFVVNTRTRNLKAPTMVAIGRAGKILSRDVDLIVCDDLEDYDSTANDTTRGQTRHWFFNTVESRKEEHTAWVTIGSRQHPDDLYEYLLEDDVWDTIVNAAHNEMCGKPPYDNEAHVDCMLFPQIRSYRWLMGKRSSAENMGLLANYEMVYLNMPRPEGLVVFRAESIRDSFNPGRILGTAVGLPDTYRLVAGLDPSATGFQAAFLWAWSKEEKRLYMVDMDNRQGGGIEQAFELFRKWLTTHDCRHWVIEENGFQRAIRQDPRIRDWCNSEGVYLEGHQTQGKNKHDPLFGVGAMARLYDEGLVDLPFGDEPTRAKVKLYERQMLQFTEGSAARLARSNRKSDVLMASWFPQKVIRRWQKETQAQMSSSHEPAYEGFAATEWTEVPW
ncbi:MAG: hypothetical protein HKO76_11535 [Acidimicrobiia bacterium]|nr:hypothetical protein [Acidimicrobiia bacterium]